jgi:hypothetical protein
MNSQLIEVGTITNYPMSLSKNQPGESSPWLLSLFDGTGHHSWVILKCKNRDGKILVISKNIVYLIEIGN